MFKIVFLFVAVVLTACYVDTRPPHPRYYELYNCSTYMYCDGYAYYDDFSTCTTLDGAYDIVDNFLFYCEEEGYYSCFTYDCSADCYAEGYVCKAE